MNLKRNREYVEKRFLDYPLYNFLTVDLKKLKK